MRRAFFFIVLVAIAPTYMAGRALAAPRLSTLTVNLLGCLSTDDPRMRLVDASNARVELDAATVIRISGGYRTRFHVASGAYRVMAASGECGGAETIGILSGVDRTVTLFGTSLTTLSGPRAALVGILPIDGLRASVVTTLSDGREVLTPAIVCGKTYYVDDYPANTNVALRIYSQEYRWVEISLTQGSMPQPYIRLDPSMTLLATKLQQR